MVSETDAAMSFTLADIKTKVGNYIKQARRIAVLGDDDELFAGGIANSLFVVQLIQYVEKEFAIEVEDQDLNFANFRTVGAIAGLVQGKLQTAVA